MGKTIFHKELVKDVIEENERKGASIASEIIRDKSIVPEASMKDGKSVERGDTGTRELSTISNNHCERFSRFSTGIFDRSPKILLSH
jgi:hypothetical protein